MQDRTNQVPERQPAGVAKKQKTSSETSVPTVQHIDVEPTTRMTRRQSRDKEEREKALEDEAAAAAIKTSSSSNDLHEVDDNIAVIKETTSSLAAVKKATVKAKKPIAIQKGKAPRLTAAKVKATAALAVKSASPMIMEEEAAAKKPPARRKMKRSDPRQCLEIIVPMYNLFYEQEDEYLVKPYMASQKDINNRMRGILVDWLVEVHYKFRLQAPTLWLCVNLLDRYLEKKPLLRNRLQLLGVTCLLVACKFEEIYPPEVRDCVYITDNAYTRDEVLTMEQSVLGVLDYQLCVPTGYNFLTRYLNIINANEKTRYLAFYYAERNLQESISFNYKPSQLMSAALYAALVYDMQDSCHYDEEDEDKESTQSVWPDLLIEETGFDETDLLPVAKILLKHVGEDPVTTSMRYLIAAKKKYLNDKFFNVAEFVLPTL